ncbi:MAG TPA: ABC transporter permease [Microlunatus sp.]|nr:ABC transporter permease [Microlunatus sp.]
MPSSAPAPGWRENGSRSGPPTARWSSLWQARDLIRFLALRDVRVRYKQAVLGVVWVLLQPIATVLIFTLVFDRLANIDSQGIPYPLFALVGMVVWTYFSTAVSRASAVLVGNPELVTKVAFPRMAAPAAAMLPPLVDVAVSMILVALLLLYYDVAPSWRILATPLWLLLLVGAAFGVALWLSALNVRYRDVQNAIGTVLQVWLFASPVAYPSTLLSGWQELVLALNPMTGVIGLTRWSLLGAPWPGWSLAVSVAVVLTLLATGILYFRRTERSFADVI